MMFLSFELSERSFTILKTCVDGQNKLSNLKILEAADSDLKTEKELGEVFLADSQELTVQTGQGCLIIKNLQTEGGKPMSAADFLNGHPEIIGMILQ